MIPGILVPTGNLGALTAHQVIVQPIAAVAVDVGDLVKFDLDDTTTYADATKYDDPDAKNNPLNVVKAAVAGSSSTTEKGGVWGVVTEAAAAGSRCKVCIAGIVQAKVNAATTVGVTTLIADAKVLKPAPSTASLSSSAPLGLALQTIGGAGTIRVLFNGFAFSNAGA